MKIKYSVIIPVYNAEKTLHRCINSILNQKRNDVEIVLVNDGSIDSSGKICEAFCQRFCQVKYVERPNGGVSRARNQGICEATGKYITFVDSDDYVAENYYITIDKVLEENDYDLVQFSRYHVNGEAISAFREASLTANSVEQCILALQESMCKKTINSPVTKVYKRELIMQHNISFPETISIGEDKVFNIKYALHIGSYKIISAPLYYVNIENGDSLSRRKRDDLKEQFSIIEEEIMTAISTSELQETDKRLLYCAENFNKCRDVYKMAKALHRDGVKWKDRMKCLNKHCCEINAYKMKYPQTKYCQLIVLPVRLKLVVVLDAIGWKLTH